MKWISVDDRLPSEINKKYFCSGPSRGKGKYTWVAQYNGKKFHGFKRRKVTHWMELPEPPNNQSMIN